MCSLFLLMIFVIIGAVVVGTMTVGIVGAVGVIIYFIFKVAFIIGCVFVGLRIIDWIVKELFG